MFVHKGNNYSAAKSQNSKIIISIGMDFSSGDVQTTTHTHTHASTHTPWCDKYVVKVVEGSGSQPPSDS